MSASIRSILLPRDPNHEFVRVMTHATVEKRTDDYDAALERYLARGASRFEAETKAARAIRPYEVLVGDYNAMVDNGIDMRCSSSSAAPAPPSTTRTLGSAWATPRPPGRPRRRTSSPPRTSSARAPRLRRIAGPGVAPWDPPSGRASRPDTAPGLAGVRPRHRLTGPVPDRSVSRDIGRAPRGSNR